MHPWRRYPPNPGPKKIDIATIQPDCTFAVHDPIPSKIETHDDLANQRGELFSPRHVIEMADY
jgi:hypothetical protein